MSDLAPTVAEVLRVQVRKLRTAKGWSARELAERCMAAGAPRVNRDTIANIEIGRRANVRVDELLALAHVLDVAPMDLLPDVGNQCDRDGHRLEIRCARCDREPIPLD